MRYLYPQYLRNGEPQLSINYSKMFNVPGWIWVIAQFYPQISVCAIFRRQTTNREKAWLLSPGLLSCFLCSVLHIPQHIQTMPIRVGNTTHICIHTVRAIQQRAQPLHVCILLLLQFGRLHSYDDSRFCYQGLLPWRFYYRYYVQ